MKQFYYNKAMKSYILQDSREYIDIQIDSSRSTHIWYSLRKERRGRKASSINFFSIKHFNFIDNPKVITMRLKRLKDYNHE